MTRKLNSWIDGFMKLTENTEPPVSYRRWTAISTIASCLQRKCWLEWGFNLYPNMYVVLVGKSGTRKTTATRLGQEFIFRLNSGQQRKVHLAADATTLEALILAIERSMISSKIGDSIVLNHSSLTVFSEEFSVFLGFDNQRLMSDLCTWYDCPDLFINATKNAGVDELKGVWLNIIGATTPESIKSMIPEVAIGGGLSSRVIFVYEDKKEKHVPFPFLGKEEVELKNKLYSDLSDIHNMSGVFKVEGSSFMDVYRDWYYKQEDTAHEELRNDSKFSGYINRRPIHILKLCMILSASRSSDMIIRLEDFKTAEEYLYKVERRMCNTYTGLVDDDLKSLITNALALLSAKGTVTRKEFVQYYFKRFELKTIDAMIETMVAMQFAKYIDRGNGLEIKYIPKKKKKPEEKKEAENEQ